MSQFAFDIRLFASALKILSAPNNYEMGLTVSNTSDLLFMVSRLSRHRLCKKGS
jgi:hypothetical protein